MKTTETSSWDETWTEYMHFNPYFSCTVCMHSVRVSSQLLFSVLFIAVPTTYSPLITSHTHSIFLHGPHMIVMLATQHCSVRHARGISYCLPHVALPRLLLSPIFLALLYIYNVMHCIHVHLTYDLFVFCPHRMTLINYEHSAEATGMEENFSFQYIHLHYTVVISRTVQYML